MNNKKTVWILLGLFIIFFTIGILSLKYNDSIRITNFFRNNLFHVEADDSQVKIGEGKIDVKDKDNHVIVGWDGIKVKTPKEKVEISWDGINIDDGDSRIRIPNVFKFNKWINFKDDLELVTIDEEKTSSIKGINNLDISSTFVDIVIRPEDRADIYSHYHGSMETNLVPHLKTEKKGDTLIIKLEDSEKKNLYTVANSDVILEIFVPNDFQANLNASASSGDIYIKNLNGNIFNLSSSSGNISLKDIEAKSLNLATSSGDIEIIDSLGEIKLTSSSGNILLNNKDISENIKISTSSGNVNIALPKDASYTITGSTLSGKFTSQVAMLIEQNHQGSFQAKIGSGEKHIDISTSSGSVNFGDQ